MSDEPILEETTPNEEPSPLAEEATVEGRVQEIQASLRTIASSESMDKATALAVTELFHEMETLFREECARRDHQMLQITMDSERQRLEVEMDRMARRHVIDQQQLQGTVVAEGGGKRKSSGR
tara:strand:- start:1572 stop:1940 length:369 start_codon:yes stop_codon:yes gene_type:complete